MNMSNMSPCAIIEAWYKKLGFPKEYDEEFYKILAQIEIPASLTVEDYDRKSTDGKRNFLAYLYFCEETARRYRALGIPEAILMDTLSDIVRWTKTWSDVKGALWLEELSWLCRHHRLTLFRLGRLQFEMGKSRYDLPAYDLCVGTPLVKIHIPPDGRLDAEECRCAAAMAREFLATYFPDFSYRYMICDSWLLDETLKRYLPESSNILRFAALFEKALEKDSCELIRYIFSWDTTKDKLIHAQPQSGFAARVKQAVLDGETFHETVGIWKE